MATSSEAASYTTPRDTTQANRIKSGLPLGYRSFEITDTAGAVLMSVPFRMALKLD